MNRHHDPIYRSSTRLVALVLTLLAAWLAVARPAAAGDVIPHRFVITDEVYDFQRFSSGALGYSGWNLPGLIGEGGTTQARVVFADDPGRTLSQRLADFGTKSCINNDYLVTADVASSLTWDGPVILDLSGVIFEPVDFAAGDWRLRPDWKTRLAAYATHATGYYNASTTVFISVFAEVTGTDLTNSEISQAANEVKLKFPAGVKVGAGYPTPAQHPLPATFPSALNVIVTWEYTVGDPRTAPYYNPSSPNDPNTRYGSLVQRIQGNQDIYFVVAGFNNGNVTGVASRTHQPTQVDFATLLRRWCEFALTKHPLRNAGLMVWKYNDAYACTTGSCATFNCSGLKRTITGAQTTFEYESSQGLNALARAYRAVYRASAFGESCWAP
jgi:hypothetical protein